MKVPIIKNPELLDKLFLEIQRGLVDNLPWLDYAFGKAERLVKLQNNNRIYYTPNVYKGGNDYIDVSPDANIGNFSFFFVDDPQLVDWEQNQSIAMKTDFALIFWFNYERIFSEQNIRNKEAIKKQILDCLNGGFLIRSGRIKIERIFELAENIYREFSLDEIDNQFLMHPYGGLRFEGELYVKESCI